MSLWGTESRSGPRASPSLCTPLVRGAGRKGRRNRRMEYVRITGGIGREKKEGEGCWRNKREK